MEDWDKYMRDFVPDDMITFQLQAGNIEVKLKQKHF